MYTYFSMRHLFSDTQSVNTIKTIDVFEGTHTFKEMGT